MNIKAFLILAIILTCQVFNFFHLPGTKPVIELSSVVIGCIYISIGFSFFRNKERTAFGFLSGLMLMLAASFAILPLLFYFLNMFTFVININYNDVLFNYYKADLNSLIGFGIFLSVCSIHFILSTENSVNAADAKRHRLSAGITFVLGVIVSVVIARKLGYHISFSRILIKLTLISSVLFLLPLLLFTGLKDNKLFVTLYLILIATFSNTISSSYLFSRDFSGARWFTYEKPVRQLGKQGIDTLQTLNSFKKIGDNFYTMEFYGDYTEALERNNKRCLEESINPGHFCSLFTSLGDPGHCLFARNFDNPQGWKCKTLVCRTNPMDGYSSLSLVRMADFGFDVKDDIEAFSFEKKKALLNAVFFTPDGINEKGLVVALAAVEERRLKPDMNKPFINCSYLVRELLDHAKDLDEAISIIKKYNIMNDVWTGSFDNHLLIADASGKSVIAEISNGEFQFIPCSGLWQATTNSPSYHVSIADQKSACSRFEAIATAMEANNGKMGVEESMRLLKKIGHQYTEWSAVYDMSQREMVVAIDHNFSEVFRFSLKTKP